jgi:Tetracyclin repressor-like, C-terminal domain
MEAVFSTVEGQLLSDVERALAGLGDARQRLRRAGREVLRIVARDQTVLRIVFVEAPATLRWSQWRTLDGGRSLAFIQNLLDDAARSGDLAAGIDPQLAGLLILGAINEAGMYVARTRNPDGLEQMQAQIDKLVQGLLSPHLNDRGTQAETGDTAASLPPQTTH